MSARPQHRDKIVRAAADLFQHLGYAATGTNEIVARAKAPKGSLYHYFPGGKEEIAQEVVRYAGGLVRATLAELAAAHSRPGDVLRAYCDLLVGWVEASAFKAGCPIATVLLEMAPDAEGIAAQGRQAIRSWTDVLQGSLAAAGVPGERAASLAMLATSALEGVLILARVERDAGPIRRVLGEVAGLFDAAVDAGPAPALP